MATSYESQEEFLKSICQEHEVQPIRERQALDVGVEALGRMGVPELAQLLGLRSHVAGLFKSDVIKFNLSERSEIRKDLFAKYTVPTASGPRRGGKSIKFYLLASPEDTRPPSHSTYTDAGLGEKIIAFPDQDCTPSEFISIIENAYEKLKGCGGFGFYSLSPGAYSVLQRIDETHPDGFNPRRICAVPGHRKYIRPFQTTLDLTPLPKNESGISDKMVRWTCLKCWEHIPSRLFEKHLNKCGETMSVSAESEGSRSSGEAYATSLPSTSSDISMQVPSNSVTPRVNTVSQPQRPSTSSLPSTSYMSIQVPGTSGTPRVITLSPPQRPANRRAVEMRRSTPLRMLQQSPLPSLPSPVPVSPGFASSRMPQHGTEPTVTRTSNEYLTVTWEADRDHRIPNPVIEDDEEEICPRCMLSFRLQDLISHCEGCQFDSSDGLANSILRLKERTLRKMRVFDEADILHPVTVNRDNFYRQGMTLFKSLSWRKLVKISVEFEGEDGIDAGGLWKEFLSMMILEAGKRLFEGEEFLLPKLSADEGELVEFGKILSYSLFFGGPSFRHLSVCGSRAMLGFTVEPSLEDCAGAVALLLLKKLQACCESSMQFEQFLSDEFDEYTTILTASGWDVNVKPSSVTDVQRMMGLVIRYDAIDSRRRVFDHIREGLHFLDVFPVLVDHPEEATTMFVSQPPQELCQIVALDLKFEGTNSSQIKTYFQRFLDEELSCKPSGLYGGYSPIVALLRFVTGSPSRPLGGWEPPLTVVVEDRPYAHASTCFNKLKIPSSVGCYEELKNLLLKCCEYGQGFYSM